MISAAIHGARHRTLTRPLLPALIALFFALPLPAGAAEGADVTFTDVALEAGFQDRLTHGRALVAADFDGDGWVDFYVGNPGDPVVANDDNFILWNEGPDEDGDFHFTKGQVLLRGEIAFTASGIDYDNDGDTDLAIGIGGQEGIGLDYLFRNDDGFFTDVSEEARVQGAWAPDGRPVPAATSSMNWTDYDNDGDLDLYTSVRIHIDTLPVPGWGSRNSLFRNEGDGTFTDVTKAAGVGSARGGMTSAWGDLDRDGWVDMYVPNHDQPAGFHFYRNDQDGTFTDMALDPDELQLGTRAVWSASTADFNNDGWLDIISFARGNPPDTDSHALFMNKGNWRFGNAAKAVGIVPPDEPVPTVMGTAVGDYDNNGYADLFMGNGGPLFTEMDRLYRNLGITESGILEFDEQSELLDYPAEADPECVPPERAERGSAPAWVDHYDMLPAEPGDPDAVDTARLPEGWDVEPCEPPYPYRGHGTVFVDYDKDGDLDLLMVKGGTAIIAPDVWSGEPNRMYRNDGGNEKSWLFVELEGVVSNRDAFGARVEVESSQGGEDRRTQYHFWQGNTGFSSNVPDEMHFGLGDDDTVHSVTVYWPSGVKTRLTDVGVNQRLVVREDVTWLSDFDDGVAGSWTPVEGEWILRDGMYGQSAPAGHGLTMHEDASLTDFTVVGKVSYVSGAGQIGLMGRVSADGTEYYGVMFDAASDTARLYKAVGGSVTELGSPIPIEPMTPARSYIVSLRFDGSWLTLTVDGESEVVIDDELTSGSVALSTNETRAAFDNIAIYRH